MNDASRARAADRRVAHAPFLARGHTNKEIAQELKLNEKTVKNGLANIYSKLGNTRRSQAAAYYASGNSLHHSAIDSQHKTERNS